jgi:hypothetical protein
MNILQYLPKHLLRPSIKMAALLIRSNLSWKLDLLMSIKIARMTITPKISILMNEDADTKSDLKCVSGDDILILV